MKITCQTQNHQTKGLSVIQESLSEIEGHLREAVVSTWTW